MRTLRANIAAWHVAGDAPAVAGNSNWAAAQSLTWPADLQSWNQRIVDGHGIADRANDDITDESVWIYEFGGQPVGAMVVDNGNGFIHIEFLVTHPGSADCGAALIQKAVELSCAANFGGKVRLAANGPTSEEFYAHLGFVNIQNGGSDTMELNPANSDKWVQGNNSYRYKPFLTTSAWLSSITPSSDAKKA
jgi:hypothetical protein